jgi:4-amino-4-deoxy-L-arabinose transferase-like glycosyltransferase
MKMRLSLKQTIASCLILCSVLLLCATTLKSYPSTEFDEGVYFTTFKSIQRGFPVYAQTYLSQPPGFFVAVYPLYVIFGSSLEAGRLAVFCNSLLGLIAIVWLGWELRSGIVGFIAISALFTIPLYRLEILTLHADALPSPYSAMALAAMFRFHHVTQRRWLVLSGGCGAFAFLTKADVSILLPIMVGVLCLTGAERSKWLQSGKALLIFAAAYAVTLLCFSLPFGFAAIYNNVVTLRLQLLATTRPDLTLFFLRLNAQPSVVILLGLGCVTVGIAAYRTKQMRLPLLIVTTWVLASLVMLAVYRPLLEHHMVLLALPTALFFAFALVSCAHSYKRASLLVLNISPTLIVIITTIWCGVSFITHFQSPIQSPNGGGVHGLIPEQVQQDGLDLILKYTEPQDYIVTDDGLIAGLSDRRVPPALVDISGAKISAGTITLEAFRENLQHYQPKLILAWAYRLKNLSGFHDLMRENGYRIIAKLDEDHIAYLHIGRGGTPL